MGPTSPSRGARHRRVVALACVAALAAGACSSDENATPADSHDVEHEAAVESSERVSLLEKLSEDDMCALVDERSVAKAFNTTVDDAEGVSRGRVPPLLTLECTYDSDGFPRVATVLDSVDPDANDKQALDEMFTDLLGDQGEVGAYQKVSGLGSHAGFGRDATLSGGGINGWNLSVIGEVDAERVLLTVSITGGKATLAQVRPLAEEMLTNLESASQASADDATRSASDPPA